MRFDVQVHGLEGLRRASGLAPKQFDVVMRHAVRVSAIQMRHVMIEETRKFAVDERFPASIRYRLSGKTALIGSMAPTALSIERGRAAGEAGPGGRIRRGVVRRGLVRGVFGLDRNLRRRIGHRSRRFAGIAQAELDEAVRIVEAIRRRGTAPKLYTERTLGRSKDRVRRNFSESVHKALRGLAQMARAA